MAKILIVDDDESFAEMTKIFLEKRGYDVLVANNGERGLEKIEEENPDLVLLDIRMPEMDGRDVKLEIQTRYPETKVAFLSMIEPPGERVADTEYIWKNSVTDGETLFKRIRDILGSSARN